MATNQTASTVEAAEDIRDIKPPLEGYNFWLLLLAVWVALLIATLLLAGYRNWRNRRKQTPSAPVIPAHIRARQKLEKALSHIMEPKPFCTMVSDTVRSYLEERFNFRAPERTTEEFLHELQATNLLSSDQKQSLGGFLESCDLVKFARYEPGETELKELHNSALRLVNETEPVALPEAVSAQPPRTPVMANK